MLVIAAVITVVFPVPGGPWIKVMRCASLLDKMALTAVICERFSVPPEKLIVTGRKDEGVFAQDTLFDGNQMR